MEDMISGCAILDFSHLSAETQAGSPKKLITAAGEIRPSSVKIELNQILWVTYMLYCLYYVR